MAMAATGGVSAALRSFCSLTNCQSSLRLPNPACELRSDPATCCRSSAVHLLTPQKSRGVLCEGQSLDSIHLARVRSIYFCHHEMTAMLLLRGGGGGNCGIGSDLDYHSGFGKRHDCRRQGWKRQAGQRDTLGDLYVRRKISCRGGGTLSPCETDLPLSKQGRDTACRAVDASMAAWPVEELRNRYAMVKDAEGPSCVFVGCLEEEQQDRLEALYMQARDAYYSGEPLILDEMFDRVETRLRWFGSKLVLKYPRCSLKRLAAYSDAEADQSQMWALAAIWFALLASGVLAATGPAACSVTPVCRDAFESFEWRHRVPTIPTLSMASEFVTILIGLVVGIPLVTCAARSLTGMVRGEVVALKGNCPNCGEEVYAFVRTETAPGARPRQKTECHVCERPLVFHANLELSKKRMGQRWAYGRVYLVARAVDLSPRTDSDADSY